MTPRRRVTAAARLRSLLVVTEGTVTEPGYLARWRRDYRRTVAVDIRHVDRTDPLGMVKETVRLMTAERRAAGGGHGGAHDEYWCVFDTDSHPKIPDALQLAESRGVGVARSNPCIELWFVLHCQDQTAHIDGDAARRLSKDHLGCDKYLTAAALDLLVANFDMAATRATALDHKHDGDGSAPGSNPSSGVCRLVERIRGA